LTYFDYPTSINPSSIAITDLNADGKADLIITGSTGNIISIHKNLSNENKPIINSFTPIKASVGQNVTIKGKNFTNTSSIHFGGTTANSFSILNDSTIIAQPGIGASGKIKLGTINGFGKKSGFEYDIPVAPVKIINAIAGNGTLGFSGDGGNSLNASLNGAYATCYDTARNWLYINDANNYRIRKIDLSTGIISTIAGNGIQGNSGNGGLAILAQIDMANGQLAVDKYGNLFFTETAGRLRKIDINTGIISLIGGGGFDREGNGLPATNAELFFVSGIVIDRDDNLYISVFDRIRKIDLTTGLIYTIAGRTTGIESDSALAIGSYIYRIGGLTIDKNKNIYFTENKWLVAELLSCKVRKLNTTTGMLTTIAGNFVADLDGDGDGGLAKKALLTYSWSITLDTSEKQLYFTQSNNGGGRNILSKIRKIDLNTGTITTLAGTGIAGYSGDGGDALLAELNSPEGISIDKKNRIYFSDGRKYIRRIGLDRVLKLCPGGSTSITTDIIGTTYQWQLALSDTSTFTNITDNAQLSGSNTATLSLNNIPSSWYGYKFRCVINGNNDRSYLLKFENVWTGAMSNAWENAANWSCGSVPDANTDVVINNGNVIIGSNVVIRTLRVMAGATVTVNSGYTLTITH
jgi:hypothetical protein